MLRNKKGFTIIEIMVVIALIGILAVVLVPKFTGVKDRAKDAGTTSNVKIVQAYTASIIDDNETYDTATKLQTAVINYFNATANQLKSPYDGAAITLRTSTTDLVAGDIVVNVTGTKGSYVVTITGYKDATTIVSTVKLTQ